MHDKTNTGVSETVEVSETFARASLVPDVVGTVATNRQVAGDKAASVEGTARAVADVAKCVSIVGAVFHAIAITAGCIRMVSEASRGRASLPRLYPELVDLLNCTSRCAMLVVDPEVEIEDLRLKYMFRIQEDCMLSLGDIEEQLMRGWLRQAWQANVVAETELKVVALREKVVIALNTRDIASVRQTVKQILPSATSAVFGDILPPPSLSPFLLVGRSSGATCYAYWSTMEALPLLSMGG